MLIKLVGTFAILVLSSWFVGEGGEILGDHYDASVVGGIIIAWLNTAPEAIFLISALESGNIRFATGAISGSAIVVCTVALGCCMWFGAHARKENSLYLYPSVRTQCLILAASTVGTMVTAIVGFNMFLGVVGVLEYVAFMYFSLTNKGAVEGGQAGAEKEHGDIEVGGGDSDSDDDEPEEPVGKGIAYLVAGGVLIFASSEPFIDSVVSLATYVREGVGMEIGRG
eukprot:TRINITY_DN1389_c0_g1_i3.p1 TRINITY_DN1389_c0_g1~~TRINITY_DN1389_c0_g1_i3.p1  ORF type:complete len:226 (-),score=64.94 TRINITY_DN1389_c0_g1_i3:1372-2049(-)